MNLQRHTIWSWKKEKCSSGILVFLSWCTHSFSERPTWSLKVLVIISRYQNLIVSLSLILWISSIIPIPGGFGIKGLVMVSIYSMVGIPLTTAAIVALIDRTIYLFFVIIIAYVSIVIMRLFHIGERKDDRHGRILSYWTNWRGSEDLLTDDLMYEIKRKTVHITSINNSPGLLLSGKGGQYFSCLRFIWSWCLNLSISG